MPSRRSAPASFEYTRKLEESYQRRIIELLEPIVGAGRVRATVTADMDFTVTEETRENYDPQKTAVRSEQTSNDQRKAATAPRAFPGRSATSRRARPVRPAIPGAATPGNLPRRPGRRRDGRGQRRRPRRLAQHAQFRGRPHAAVREAADRHAEAPERRRGARRLAEVRRRRQGRRRRR
jgi:hypothetical protein